LGSSFFVAFVDAFAYGVAGERNIKCRSTLCKFKTSLKVSKLVLGRNNRRGLKLELQLNQQEMRKAKQLNLWKLAFFISSQKEQTMTTITIPKNLLMGKLNLMIFEIQI
jgi:hypothetical protein